MKEPIILIKDIRKGCYSLDEKERAESKGGFLMKSGAKYIYAVDPNFNYGKGFYYCGTHIILEQDIDWSMFISESKYYALQERIKKEME